MPVTETRCDVCGTVRFDGNLIHRCYVGPKGDRVMKITEATSEITRGRQKAENAFLVGDTVTITDKMVKDGSAPAALSGKAVPKVLLPFIGGKTHTIECEDGDKPFTIINQMRDAAEQFGLRVSVAPAEGVSAKVDKDTKVFRVKWSVKAAKS